MREREKRKRASKLLSSILEVLPIGIRRAKSESSSTRRGLHVHTKKEGFHQKSKEFRAKEASYPCYYTARGKDSSYFDLFPP